MMAQSDVIRNEALLLLISLAKANQDIQKIAAFEGAFERLLKIIRYTRACSLTEVIFSSSSLSLTEIKLSKAELDWPSLRVETNGNGGTQTFGPKSVIHSRALLL